MVESFKRSSQGGGSNTNNGLDESYGGGHQNATESNSNDQFIGGEYSEKGRQ